MSAVERIKAYLHQRDGFTRQKGEIIHACHSSGDEPGELLESDIRALLARVEEQEQEIANYKRELLAASVDAETAQRAAYERAIEIVQEADWGVGRMTGVIAAIRREMEGI